MMRKFTTLFALIMFFSFNANSQDFYYSPEGKSFLQVSQQKILVQFKAGTNFTEQQQILSEHKEIKPITRDMVLPAPKVTLVDLQNVSSESDVYTLLQKLATHPKVDYANHFLAHKDGTLHGVMDRVLVRLKSEGQYSFFENEMKQNLFVLNHERNEFDPLLMEVTVVGIKNALTIANELHESQNYAYAEPDFLRLMKRMNTNDPNVDEQWSLNNDGVNTSQYGGTVGADMKVYNAWGTTTGSSTIKVAIIDEGVDLNHPDLAGNMLGGYDATGQGSGGNPSGDDAHGTACAGIVASVGNNNIGGTGVAYDSKIIPVRIAYSSGSSWVTSNAWIGNSLNWAINNADADILSNSWGGGGSSSTINNAIDNAINNGRGGLGSPVLFAAGNDNGANSYPATYAPTISVIAMSMCNQRKNPSSCDGETWWGSNYGSGADVAAPGVKIFATDISGSAGYSSGDYTSSFNGTSSACPNAAGVMALVLSANGSLTETQARAALEGTTDKVGGYTYNSNVSGQPNGTWSNDLGHGRINAEAAVSSVSSSTANDAGITSVTSPIGSVCATSASPVVVLRNYGSNTLSSVTINYSLDGGSNSTYSWTGSLAQNGSASVTLPSVSFAGGSHTFDASTSNPNGQADENTVNDDASSSFSSGSNGVTLSITLDNYPEETSWSIVNAGGNTVASGGTYGNEPDGSTISIAACLADGCYDFIINDVYGDGICCSYGNGSYTLTEDASGTVLATGGSFGSSETTNFCVPVSPTSNVDVTISSSSNISCNGGSDGSATAAGSGGTTSINYSWSNGANGATASGLSAGTYTVTATDGTTSSSVSVSITEPLAVVVSISGTNASGGNNGSATATAGGGTPGFSYNWSNGGSTSTINNLGAGTYIVTASDSRGCTATDNVVITDDGGNPVNVSISSSSNVSCNGGSDGSATAAGTGGSTPITYAWNNGGSSASISGLSAGTYTVTATDGVTSSSASIIISQPSAILVNYFGLNPSAGGSNGSASATPSGGTPGYSYNWSNGGSTALINNLVEGTYSVTVTDANDCEVTGSITLVDEPGGGCTYETINSNGFESGWGIWNDGGSDCRRSANDNQYATTGTYCVRIRDNTSTSTATTDNLDLSNYDEVTVDFAYYARSMDNSNEDFWLQVSTNGGSSYTTVEEWNRGDEFQNNTFNTAQVVIPSSSISFTSTTRFRFRCDASGNSDWIYLDDIVITGCSNSPSGSSPGSSYDPKIIADKDFIEVEEIEKTIQEVNLFPNPTNNILNVEFELTNNSDVKMMVMSLTGQVVEMRDLKLEEGTQQFKIDVNRFDHGVYFIHLITNDERISKKFIVVD
ncbi:MAG: S8 family serine peptidase [Saprospiraceae bacterium]